MKFKFKIQQYQTDAVDAVVRVFNGQPFQDHVSYRRDVGHGQTSFLVGDEGEIGDIETGFKNATIELTDDQLLRTIQKIQSQNNIKLSSGLISGKNCGRCSLDIEMETGTGKTYVYIKTMFELSIKRMLSASQSFHDIDALPTTVSVT